MVRVRRSEHDHARGLRLEEALRIRRISKMYALSIEIGVNESAISRWRRGAPITTDNLIKLCNILNISADWLLLGRGNIDRHIDFHIGVDERIFLENLRLLPNDFMIHIGHAVETIIRE